MVVIPRLVYNFNHSKTRSICWKKFTQANLGTQSLSPHDGELCFNFSSPEMQMITWHLRRSTCFTWKSAPWKSGDSGIGNPSMASGSSPFNFFFLVWRTPYQVIIFFGQLGVLKSPKLPGVSAVLFFVDISFFFQRWKLCTRIASNKQTRSRTHLLWLHPFTKLTCFLKRGHFKRKVVFQPLFFLGENMFLFRGAILTKKSSNPLQLSSKSSDLVRAWVGGVTMLPEICTSKTLLKIGHTYCWWFRNPVNSPVEGMVVFSHDLPGFLYIPGGCLGCLPSTVGGPFEGRLYI